MKGLNVVDGAESSPLGLLHINVGRVLGPLQATAGKEKVDKYIVACAKVQFWADLIDIVKLNCFLEDLSEVDLDNQLRSAESEAECAADVILEKNPVVADSFRYPDVVSVPFRIDSHIDLLRKVLHLPMPECCGYDLADLELIVDDVLRLIACVTFDRPFLIVGIRTGGTYLAPLWAAALKNFGYTDAIWCTTRLGTKCGGLRLARKWLRTRSKPVVVVVDDRPDSGNTMALVAMHLRGGDIDLWFSSVGRIWRGSSTSLMPAVCSVRKTSKSRIPRLWECLLPDRQPDLITRLQETLNIPALSDGALVHIRCPQGELRYGKGEALLPWNDPRVLSGRRPLVNPRKTPIEIRDRRGQVFLHLRFIGESVFGRAEFDRVQKIGPTEAAWLIDGYAITVDIGSASEFRRQFSIENQSGRADLIRQAANWLIAPESLTVAHSSDSLGFIATRPRWFTLANIVHQRFGFDPLHELSASLCAFLFEPVPWPGRTRRLFRSSLRYGCGGWHWQVDRGKKLHRFQLEANWGDVSYLELEVAVFALENALSIDDANDLASRCELKWSGIRLNFPLAALVILESRVRSVMAPSNRGKVRFFEDYRQLMRSVSELAEIPMT